MSTNPFEARLALQAQNHPNFQEAEAEVQTLVRTATKAGREHQKAWDTHLRAQHERRLEQALEHEELKTGFVPPTVQAAWDAEDDRRFAYLTEFNQLLELKSHELYLRGRRAWERRHKVEDVEVNVIVKAEPAPRTGSQLWSTGLGLVLLVVFIIAFLREGPGVLFVAPFLFVLWLFLSRVPGIYAGTFSSGGGARGVSGNAV